MSPAVEAERCLAQFPGPAHPHVDKRSLGIASCGWRVRFTSRQGIATHCPA